MILNIVYDNEAKEGFRTSWGFSVYIDNEDEIVLFDTGATGRILTYNMEKMGLDAEDIDKIVLSHEHSDHTGGLFSVLDGSMKVYVPTSFSGRFKNQIDATAELVEVDGSVKVSKGIRSTGEFKTDIPEHALILDTDEGYVLLTGCAHPGLGNMMDKAEELSGDLYGVIGGFHGFNDVERLEDLESIIPCHCTKYKKKIIERFPDKTKNCSAGCIFEFDKNG
ncbi:MAG: MBL fold metallo-hydrolase [Thermoplasmatota archaeon]